MILHTLQPLKASNLASEALAVAQHGPCIDLVMIAGFVPQGTHVLDVGCGAGRLLEEAEKGVDGRGVEISQGNINICVWRGLSGIQSDADSNLVFHLANPFDVVGHDANPMPPRNPLAGAALAAIAQTHGGDARTPPFFRERHAQHSVFCIAA